MKKGLIWMLFWEFIFAIFILPWAWLPVTLGLLNDKNEPKFVRWIINQAIGNF